MRIITRGFYDSYRLRALKVLVETRPSLFRPEGAQSVVLDIGTNVGNHAIFFSGIFDRVIAFEPIPALVAVTRASLMVNGIQNVTLHEVGLSDANLSRTIGVQLHNFGASSLHLDPTQDGRVPLEIRVMRGDDVLASAFGPQDHVGLVKIDVEGHEAPALKGLRATLARFSPVIWFEAHGRTSGDEVRAVLDGLGYKHVYVFGDLVELRGETLRGALARVLRGMQFKLNPVKQIPDCRYMNIVVSTVPLD